MSSNNLYYFSDFLVYLLVLWKTSFCMKFHFYQIHFIYTGCHQVILYEVSDRFVDLNCWGQRSSVYLNRSQRFRSATKSFSLTWSLTWLVYLVVDLRSTIWIVFHWPCLWPDRLPRSLTSIIIRWLQIVFLLTWLLTSWLTLSFASIVDLDHFSLTSNRFLLTWSLTWGQWKTIWGQRSRSTIR